MRLVHAQSTVSYAPSFEEDENDGPGGGRDDSPEGAALIELDQVEGTAGRRMHDIGHEMVTVGRNPESAIFLDDVTVSRRHVEFVRENNAFVVRDVGSLNGTYVNREPIDTAILSGGDEVQIGKFRLVFLTSGAGEGPAGKP